MNLKYRNLFISLTIIVVWLIINFLVFYPDKQGLGSTFGVSVLYIITAYSSLGFGVILLLLRIIKIWKNPGALLYILTGVVNITIGLVAIALYFFHLADREWLNKSLLNLLFGVLILADVYLLDH